MIEYYRMVDQYKGHHYFKVNPITMERVVKITVGTQPKAGRPYCFGITLLKYVTFTSSYGWRKDDPNYNTNIQKISKKEYEDAFDLVVKRLRSSERSGLSETPKIEI